MHCACTFTLCGNNFTRKYWLIADRPNEAKKMWSFFAHCPDFMGGMPPPLPTPLDLIEKFKCAGKFTMCGKNVTKKYWLIADRLNED